MREIKNKIILSQGVNKMFFQDHFEKKKSLLEYSRNCAIFSLQLMRNSSKLRNKSKILVLIWKKIPEKFAFIHSMIFDLFTAVLQRIL